MGFTIKWRKRNYHFYFGYDGTKRLAWGWRPAFFDGDTVIYRFHPFSLMIYPA